LKGRLFWAGMVVVLLIIGTTVLAAQKVRVVVDGAEKALDVAPKIEKGVVWVPLRCFSEMLGNVVNWNSSTKTVSIVSSASSYSSSEENSVVLSDLKIEDWGNYDSLAAEMTLPENISELSKEEKAEILEKLLAHSYSVIKYAVTKKGDWGDYELWLNAQYHSIHGDYVKFINLFSQEFLTDQSLGVLEDIDIAYSNVLKTFEMSGRPYLGLSGFSGSMTKTYYNQVLVLNKFGYYLSFGAKYDDIPGVPAPKEYQDPESDFTVYDIPAVSGSNNIIWGQGESLSQLDNNRIEVRKRLFRIVNPYSGTITEGFIQKELMQKLGIPREEVDYLIDLYKDYRLREGTLV